MLHRLATNCSIAVAFALAAIAIRAYGEAQGSLAHWFISSQEGPLQGRANYEARIDPETAFQEFPSALLRSKSSRTNASGTLMQQTRADSFRGKRIELSAHLRSRDVTNEAGLWIRAEDEAGAVLVFKNLQSSDGHTSFVRENTEWTNARLVVDIPASAVSLYYGVQLEGPGCVWISHVQFSILGDAQVDSESGIPTIYNSVTPTSQLLANPSNLNFDTP